MNDKELQLIEDYERIKPALQRWGNFVDETLTKEVLQELNTGNFVKILPNNRVKDCKSFLFKAFYRQNLYENPFIEIEDKVGTRVVVLKSDDIATAADLIIGFKGWKAKITKELRQQIEDQPKIFDYQSLHIVVFPESNYTDELGVDFLSCEIQIRTLLQHAFAEVSHDSTYKGPYRNDADILRDLAKSMALMEATDDYFCRIFNLMSDEKREISVFLRELTTLYKQLQPTFDNSVNFDLTDRLLGLQLQQKISLEEIERFMQKRKKELARAISKKNGAIFEQPISLLVSYYIHYHQTFLKENWPLNLQSLKDMFKAFNISFEQY